MRLRITLAAAVVVAVAGCASPAAAVAPARAEMGGGTTALDVLAHLPSRLAGDVPGYERDEFGDGWADEDEDCRNTRNEVLARDLTGIRVSGDGCRVVSGRLVDSYSGRVIEFRAGRGTSDDVQVDHVWPLGAAWDAGAAGWTGQRREQFGNDPRNLQAVDGPTNNAKGDRLPDRWLPPNIAYRCEYMARVVGVGAEYGLSVTSSERAAMARVLGGCPGQEVPR